MGLFRRGTQLLRLGSGLRDCCCRPEQPEECWCPDWCRYYWDWGGTTLFPANEYLKDICNSPFDQTSIRDALASQESLGFLSTILNVSDASVSGFLYAPGGLYGQGIYFSYGIYVEGLISSAAHEDIFGFPDDNTFGSYYIRHSVGVFCKKDSQGKASSFIFDADSIVDIRAGRTPVTVIDPSNPPYFIQQLTRASYDNELSVSSTCEKNGELFCFEPPNNFPTESLHLTEDIAFEYGTDGITVNGVFYEWVVTPVGVYGFGDIDNGSVTDLWKVAGDFPFEATVTLKRRDSCQPGDCDCEVDLTGRTVVFEGQEFTYGSLQQFISDDGFTIWEEGPSAGIFTRDDRRPCDGTVSMRIRKAEVSCSTFDGVPRWFVYLDSECYERESGGCSPTVTASKITLYNGAFSCDSDGYPLGAAHSFTDDTDPPDFDQENISGTLSANCDSENPIPSISFS
jgi:hypothetical protein